MLTKAGEFEETPNHLASMPLKHPAGVKYEQQEAHFQLFPELTPGRVGRHP